MSLGTENQDRRVAELRVRLGWLGRLRTHLGAWTWGSDGWIRGVQDESMVGIANFWDSKGLHGPSNLLQLPKSGADRDGDPLGVGYGARRECKFDPANQNDNERRVAENPRTVHATGTAECNRCVPF
jgi:hypothetical protein